MAADKTSTARQTSCQLLHDGAFRAAKVCYHASGPAIGANLSRQWHNLRYRTSEDHKIGSRYGIARV
jgi:hypothetical protein